MKWTEYRKNFIKEATKTKKGEEYYNEYLKYAKNLFNKKLPIIYNNDHLSKLLGYRINYLYAIVLKRDKFYRKYTIPKKNGGKREIFEPLLGLKNIQTWILVEILNNIKVSRFAKAYVIGNSIKDNVRFHKNKKIVLTLDVKNYFGSIKSRSIYEIFINMGYQENVASLLTNLCVLYDSLPQGAPTSAALSNIYTIEMDNEIAEYTTKRKIMYTRYADDMTFSGAFNVQELCKVVSTISKKYGFVLNKDKTRVRHRWQQQEVTGIVVNEKMQLSKKREKR